MKRKIAETDDVLGIYFHKNENGSFEYRARGTGKKYKKFYKEWIPNSSYVCVGEDFPWDYFRFNDPNDHDRLLKDYPEDVFDDSEE